MAVFINQPGNNVFNGSAAEYDQVDYTGSLRDYNFIQNDDGTITVSHPTLGTDTLSSIEGFWFSGEQAWYSIEQAIEISNGNGNPILTGTNGNDNLVGSAIDNTFIGSAGNDTINGNGGTYNQVDYPGSIGDYTFEQNVDGSVTIQHANGTDTLTDIDGFWFSGEGAWYSLADALLTSPPNTDDFTADSSTSGVISADGSATGTIEEGRDRDWFAIDGEPGQTIRFSVDGEASVTLSVYDAQGNLLVDAGVAGPTGSPSTDDIEFTIPDDGQYFVEVRSFGFRAEPVIGDYTISTEVISDGSVDDFTADSSTSGVISADGSATGTIEEGRDRDWFAIDGEPGQTIRFSVDGEASVTLSVYDAQGNLLVDAGVAGPTGSPSTDDIFFTIPDDGQYFVEAESFGFRAEPVSGEYTISSELVTDDFGDDIEIAENVSVDGPIINGAIDNPGDVDVFAVDVTAGQELEFTIDGDGINATIILMDADGNTLQGPSAGSLEYTSASNATVFVQVQVLGGSPFTIDDDWGNYQLAVVETNTPAQPFVEGTTGDDILTGSNIDNVFFGGEGDDIIDGNGGNYNQADYSGSINDYAIFANGDGTYTVSGAEGTDTLMDIDGFWFGGDAQWYSLQQAVDATANDFLV